MSSLIIFLNVIYDVPEVSYSFYECELMNSHHSTMERLYFGFISLFLNK